MRNPNISVPTLTDVATQFKLWRQTKTSKWQPIPDYLKQQVEQLIPHYTKNEIMHTIQLDITIFNKIKNFKYKRQVPFEASFYNEPGSVSTGNVSNVTRAPGNKQQNSYPQDNLITTQPCSSNHDKISFTPFKVVPLTDTVDDSDPGFSSNIKASEQVASPAACICEYEIIRPDNAKLTIRNSDLGLTSVIRAFLCCN